MGIFCVGRNDDLAADICFDIPGRAVLVEALPIGLTDLPECFVFYILNQNRLRC